MDIFQLFGDFLHLMAVLLLVLKILANRNVVGIQYTIQVSPTKLKKSILLFLSLGT